MGQETQTAGIIKIIKSYESSSFYGSNLNCLRESDYDLVSEEIEKQITDPLQAEIDRLHGQNEALVLQVYDLKEQLESRDKEIDSLTKSILGYQEKIGNAMDTATSILYDKDLLLDASKQVNDIYLKEIEELKKEIWDLKINRGN